MPPWTKFKSVKKAWKKCTQSEISYKQSGLYADKLLMEADNNSLADTLRRAKGDYENSLVDSLKDNPKRIYNYARNFNKTSATVEAFENSVGITVTEDACKANLLNDIFASVQTDETPLIGKKYQLRILKWMRN